MSKTRDTGFLGNVIKVDNGGNVSLVSGSTTLLSVSSSGAVTITGTISGSTAESAVSSSYALTASYSSNAELLDGMDSTMFAFTSSFNTTSASLDAGLKNVIARTGSFATTGSNVFYGNQTVSASMFVSGSVTATGQIVAQTINVQSVTSSVVYSSGSNVFGNTLSDTQRMTGSLLITGSLTVTTTGVELAVNSTGVSLGNALTDVHQVTGSLLVSGSIVTTGTICSTGNACFGGMSIVNSCIGIGTSAPTRKLTIEGSGVQGATTGAAIRLDNTTSGRPAIIDFDDSQNFNLIASTDSGNIRFITGTGAGSEKVRITAGGDLTVGSTSAGNAGTINVSVGCAGTTAGGLQLWATSAQTHYVQFGDGTAGAGPYAGYVGYAHSTDSLLLGAGAATRAIISSTGIACFACQVCAPHFIAVNNISIGSSCTVSDGYNTRLRITCLANDTFVFSFNNQACKPIMFMYGGNTSNPQGYTAWVDNTTNNANHKLSHITTDATYFAAQGGRVGIGTTTPCTVLSVNSGINTSSANAISIMQNTNGANKDAAAFGVAINNGGESTNAADLYISTATGGALCERMRITSGGNVGIGCASPSYVLDVRDGTTGSAGGRGMRLSVCSNSAGPQFRLEYQCSGNSRNWLIGTNQEASGDFIIRSSTVPGCDPGGSCSITRFSISKDGCVGIGIAFPTATLTVEGANSAFPLTYNSGFGNIHIQTNETTATQNYGGTLTFGGLGRTSGPTEKFIWAAIAGRKEVTTSGDPRGYLQFGTTSDDTNQTKERMRITNDGYLRLASKGIQFNGDTADANSLDDYEEGTWTPAWSSAGGTINTNTTFTTGTYTKIGNVVHIWARLYTNSVSSPTGEVTVSGLPFTVGSQVGNKAMFLFTMNAINATLTGTPTIAFNNSATTAKIYNKIWNSTEFGGDIATYFDNDTWGYFYGTYLI